MYRIAFVALVLSVTGCFGPSAYVDRTASNYLAMQIKASRDIPDYNARASAMVAIARSAAYGEHLDHFSAAMREIKGDPRHDETAVECATFLADNGKVDSAKKVAKKIDDAARRQTILDHIAEKSNASATATPLK